MLEYGLDVRLAAFACQKTGSMYDSVGARAGIQDRCTIQRSSRAEVMPPMHDSRANDARIPPQCAKLMTRIAPETGIPPQCTTFHGIAGRPAEIAHHAFGTSAAKSLAITHLLSGISVGFSGKTTGVGYNAYLR